MEERAGCQRTTSSDSNRASHRDAQRYLRSSFTVERMRSVGLCGETRRACPSVKRRRATAFVVFAGSHKGHRAAEREHGNTFGLTPLDRRPLAGSQQQIRLFWFVTPNSALQRINGTSWLPALVFTRTMTSGESGSSYRGPVDR